MKTRGRKPFGKDGFIERSILEYGGKYDYSLIKEFKTTDDNVDILCPKHGIFNIRAYAHLQGAGCRKCKSEAIFIEKANKIYKNKYDYSKIKFTRMCDKVEIICPIHGSFFRSPEYHLTGTGCKECNK